MPATFVVKRAAVVEAEQWDGSVEGATRIIDWVLGSPQSARYHEATARCPAWIALDVPEGGSESLTAGVWVVRAEDGVFRACEPGIFEANHTEAEDDVGQCTCTVYVVDYSHPDRYHPENLDEELTPGCPEHDG